MTFWGIIPIENHSMSIFTFIILFFSWIGAMAIVKWLMDRDIKMETSITQHSIDIANIKNNNIETNTIVKRIDKNMDTVLSEAQKLNARIIESLLKD